MFVARISFVFSMSRPFMRLRKSTYTCMHRLSTFICHIDCANEVADAMLLMKVWRLLIKNAMQTFSKRDSRKKSRKRRRNATRKQAVSVFVKSELISVVNDEAIGAFVSCYEFNCCSLLPVSTKLPYALPFERVMLIIHLK
jgi:hypothetical protein